MKEVSFLILDEADEMLDQGFEPQINKALMRVRSDRQTILTRYVLNYKVLIGTLNFFILKRHLARECSSYGQKLYQKPYHGGYWYSGAQSSPICEAEYCHVG
jgi:DEAD/DEAH box helicase